MRGNGEWCGDCPSTPNRLWLLQQRSLSPLVRPLLPHTRSPPHAVYDSVKRLTPWVLGIPWTAAHPGWSRISQSPTGSVEASEGGFCCRGPLWQPWSPSLFKPRQSPPPVPTESTTSPPASPWYTAEPAWVEKWLQPQHGAELKTSLFGQSEFRYSAHWRKQHTRCAHWFYI